jgi:hypothetical protein
MTTIALEKRLTIDGAAVELVSERVVLELSAVGYAVFHVREPAMLLGRSTAFALRYVTPSQVLEQIEADTGLRFILPTQGEYLGERQAHFAADGTHRRALDLVGARVGGATVHLVHAAVRVDLQGRLGGQPVRHGGHTADGLAARHRARSRGASDHATVAAPPASGRRDGGRLTVHGAAGGIQRGDCKGGVWRGHMKAIVYATGKLAITITMWCCILPILFMNTFASSPYLHMAGYALAFLVSGFSSIFMQRSNRFMRLMIQAERADDRAYEPFFFLSAPFMFIGTFILISHGWWTLTASEFFVVHDSTNDTILPWLGFGLQTTLNVILMDVLETYRIRLTAIDYSSWEVATFVLLYKSILSVTFLSLLYRGLRQYARHVDEE